MPISVGSDDEEYPARTKDPFKQSVESISDLSRSSQEG